VVEDEREDGGVGVEPERAARLGRAGRRRIVGGSVGREEVGGEGVRGVGGDLRVRELVWGAADEDVVVERGVGRGVCCWRGCRRGAGAVLCRRDSKDGWFALEL
jgi:hypothetical protein